MKTGIAPGPSDVSLELIAAIGGVGIQVMAETWQNPKWILNASWLHYSREGLHQKLQLL